MSNKLVTFILSLVLSLGAFVLNLPQTARAQALFDSPRPFTVTKNCEAFTSLRKESYPVPVLPGQTYTAFGENKNPGGTHAQIELDGQRKWVPLSCGQFEGSAAPVADDGGDRASDCLPFFDDTDNPVRVGFGGVQDISPVAPVLSEFDRAVNEVCGKPGKAVSREEFKQLMYDYPQVLAAIREFTGGKVYGDRPTPGDEAAYLEDLTDAWFNIHGFDHIICAEPKAGSSIGGFHFWGRYLELQEKGLACRLPNLSRAEVLPGVIYTMGARMKVDGGVASSPIKGYGLTLSAADILKAVTKAFADNPTESTDSQGCLLPMEDDGQEFVTVFVRRAGGIRTFYPDATPDPNRNPQCKEEIVLSGK